MTSATLLRNRFFFLVSIFLGFRYISYNISRIFHAFLYHLQLVRRSFNEKHDIKVKEMKQNKTLFVGANSKIETNQLNHTKAKFK